MYNKICYRIFTGYGIVLVSETAYGDMYNLYVL